MAAARLQRWAVTLASYSYTMEFKYSKDNASADALSRLPRPETEEDETELAFRLEELHNLPVTAQQLANATRRDPVLSKVLYWTLSGWPQSNPEPAIKPQFQRKNELSVTQGCVLWGLSVVIPTRPHDARITLTAYGCQ